MKFGVVAGCSHTAGIGIDPKHCYVNLLQQHYGFPCHNLGINGGNCDTVLETMIQIMHSQQLPTFVVIQWPNPFRRTAWIDGKKILQNINDCDPTFSTMLKNGEENFYQPWIRAVILANLLAQQAHVPLINIYLDSMDKQYLDQLQPYDIIIHCDEKLPDRTWLFDSKGTDGLHHSALCHQQWAQRLLGIIDEHTT